jgi:hypothetical protein
MPRDFYVAKATEFETCKRIPRFSKPVGAVIHPLDPRRTKDARHKAPRTLQFDGSPARLGKRPEFHADRGLPEHLVRPAIDEEKLLQIRARDKLRRQEERTASSKKKVSMEVQKTQKAFAKLRSDVNIKIKGAEKNLKLIFSDFKSVLEKNDAEQVVAGGTDTVEFAKAAEADGRLCSFMFDAWKTAEAQRRRNKREFSPDGDGDGAITSSSYACTRQDFVKFARHFLGATFGSEKAADIFMHNLCDGSQLKVIQRLISEALSPNTSKLDDTMEATGGRFATDKQDSREQHCDPTDPLHFSMRTYGLRDDDRERVTVDCAGLDEAYNVWAKDDSSIGELTNAKLVGPKNREYQAKLKSWAARHQERKLAKKKTVQYEKELWEYFNKEMPFKKDLYMVNQCRDDLQRTIEDMKQLRNENKQVNNFLKGMSLDVAHSVLLDDFDKALGARKLAVTARLHLVDDFVGSVKNDCALDRDYFNFFDLPDHVAKRNYSRADYEGTILKMMLRVKDACLEEKKRNSDTPDQVGITEHDLTPLDLFDVVASQMKNKQNEQTMILSKFITECKDKVTNQVDKVKDQFTEKTRKTIEQNFFVDLLKNRMDNSNLDYFEKAFQVRNLYIAFVKKTEKEGEYSSAKAFTAAYDEVFKCRQMGNKYHSEFEKKRATEVRKFGGVTDGPEGSETASRFYGSEPSSATRLTSRKSRPGSASGSPEKRTEHSQDPSVVDDDASLGIEELANREMDEEDQEEAEAALEAERKKKASGESDYPEFFVYTKGFAPKAEQEGERFVPMKRFGNLESEGVLIHDRITSSYKLNLPTDVYQKHIADTLPRKDDGDGKWFIRPHHLENLTKHPRSICDDLLNTRYFSHYNLDYGNKQEENIAQTAIERIEAHLGRLKAEAAVHMRQRGQSPEVVHDELYE